MKYVVMGLKRKTAGQATDTCLPITVQILHDLKHVWERTPGWFNASVLWAASCLCFIWFLYTGKIILLSNAEYDVATHLSVDDILVENVVTSKWLEICIKASKTDPV